MENNIEQKYTKLINTIKGNFLTNVKLMEDISVNGAPSIDCEKEKDIRLNKMLCLLEVVEDNKLLEDEKRKRLFDSLFDLYCGTNCGDDIKKIINTIGVEHD